MWLKIPQNLKDNMSDNELGQATAAVYMAKSAVEEVLNVALKLGNEATDNLNSMADWLGELEEELDKEYKQRERGRAALAERRS